MEVLDDDEIKRRIAALEIAQGGSETEDDSPSQGNSRSLAAGNGVGEGATASSSYISPLTDVADALIDSLHSEDGIGLGLPEIDILTRGFRPSELILITGFAHAGKSQLVNTMLHANLDKRILYFSLDEPAALVLAKLVAMHTDLAAEELERLLSEGDEDTRKIVRDVAQNVFTSLVIVDDVIGLDEMEVAIQEATDFWGAPPQAVVVDYDELVPTSVGAGDDTSRLKQLLNQFKAKAKEAQYPWIVLHQGSRSNSSPGEPITMKSLNQTGEQQGTVILGVRRKRDLKELSPAERIAHEHTVSVHIVKNKKAGGRTTSFEGLDFRMVQETGLIRPLTESERRRLYEPQSATAVAARVGQESLSW